MTYKAQLQSMLFDLNNKPHCLDTKHAHLLKGKIQQYLEGDNTQFPETDIINDGEPAEVEPEVVNTVAVIEINGCICKRVGLPDEWLELLGLCDLDNVDAELNSALADSNVTKIILFVNSPGGFLSGVQSTANLVAKVAETKEVVVYSDVLNASAAYFISSQASSIISSVDADIGSIGVYLSIEDWSKAYDELGVKVTLIKSGKYKAIGDPSQPLTDEQKTYLQDEVNKTHALFKSYVTAKRSISPDDMEGQCFSGDDLYNKGFVDGYAENIDAVINELTANN